MEINKRREEKKLFVELIGRLDTNTSGQLEEAVNADIEEIEFIQLDFAKLEYISSAGLRVLLSLQKIMNKQGEMEIIHVSDEVKEVFEITGFLDVLTIK